MNSNVSIPVSQTPGVNATRGDALSNVSANRVGQQDQHEFAKALDRARTDESRSPDKEAATTETMATNDQPVANDNAKGDAQHSAQGHAQKTTEQTSSEQSNAEAQSKEDSRQDEVLAESAAELLLMMGINTPASTPVTPTLPSDGTARTAGLSATTGIPPVTTPVATQDSNAAALMLKDSSSNAPAKSDVPSDTAVDATTKPETPAIPAWLLKNEGDVATSSDKQHLLDLSNSFARMLDRTQDNSQDKDRSKTVSGEGMTLASSLTALGSAAGTQTAQDLSAIQQTRHVLHTPVGSAGWATELGNKLVVLSKSDTPTATLHVTPADLGPMQIRIETQHNQASVWFTADNPDTRSAIEQSLPKLREMFSAQGLVLNDAGVFGDRSGQQAAYTAARASAEWARRQPEADEIDTVTVRTLSLSVVDTYA